ncbi:condensation domain-containing protein [Nocardia takedensis]|uniref:condensation domain-containing protein n=1 Tax=Nocardia takedensis TaxID=259390 RepID=UPI00031914BB|nr:condensation domain-containing protein [Nocardia takedensis]
MRVTTIDHLLPRPGTFVRFTAPSAAGELSPVPPSFNQSLHLAAATNRPSTWLAAAFEIPGPVDLRALAAAYRALIARHGTLRSSFLPGDTGPLRLRHPLASALIAEFVLKTETAVQTREVLRASLDAACAPFGHPSYLLGAIDRPDSATVVCGFDHAHVDGYSIALIIDDLRRLYAGAPPDSLPEAGDFVDHCAEQAAMRVEADDPRVRGWQDFFGIDGATPPPFPLDLGLAPGQTAPQAVVLRELLDTVGADRFETWCRALGAGVFAGCASAMGHAVRALTGRDRLSLLFPLHTRHHDRWRTAVGWFVNNAPLRVDSAATPDRTVRATGHATRTALALGTMPTGAVLAHLGGLRPTRGDVFMTSYIDYRRLPGAAHHREVAATHISASGHTDDAQFWFSRTTEGLALRVRHPDTPTARATMSRFCHELQHFVSSAPNSTTSRI